MPTRDEIRNLTQRVEELNAKIEQLKPRVTPAAAARDRDAERPRSVEDRRIASSSRQRGIPVLSSSGSGGVGEPGVLPRIGLALAAGAPEGAIYEIGALRALDEALDGLDFNNLFIYVGVSAGAFLCANLANDLTTAQMCRAIVSQEPGEHPFTPETFFTPASATLGRGARKVPRAARRSLWDWVTHLRDRTLLESLTRLSRAAARRAVRQRADPRSISKRSTA